MERSARRCGLTVPKPAFPGFPEPSWEAHSDLTNPQGLSRNEWGFGGIRARYRRHPGRVLRLVDPFEGIQVHFRSPIQYENWLLRRFEPSIYRLSATPLEWSAVHRGVLVKVKPHLCWVGRADGGHLELVAEPGKDISARQLEALDVVARAHQLRPLVRTCQHIRSHPRRLALLERMRQVLTLYLSEWPNSSAAAELDSVLDALRRVRRGQLWIALQERSTSMSQQQMDAALFWGRQRHQYEFDITSGDFDDNTLIQRLPPRD